MYTVYILYSLDLNRYYTSYTSGELKFRLAKYLIDHTRFTSRTKDWQFIYSQELSNKSDALLLEKNQDTKCEKIFRRHE